MDDAGIAVNALVEGGDDSDVSVLTASAYESGEFDGSVNQSGWRVVDADAAIEAALGEGPPTPGA